MSNQEDKIFNNDPLYMVSLIGKKVSVTTKNNIFLGIVYVVDPIYKTIILHTNRQSENDFEVVVILHHAIQKLTILSEEIIESYLKRPEEPQLDKDYKEVQKKIIKKWLEHMFLTVTESGDYLKIDDHLVIVPPYGSENCICNNTIVLDKIQKIMELMPPDFK